MNYANVVMLNNEGQQIDDAKEFDLEKLFNTQYKNLSRFIERRVSCKEDAEDLLQSTFYEALRNQGNFKGNSKPETWLFGIAVNLIRNYFKKHYAMPAFSELNELDIVDDEIDNDLCSTVERQNELEAILDAVDDLPDYAREIVDLVIDMDFSYQAAADYLGVPVGTVRSRLFRARKMLKDAISV